MRFKIKSCYIVCLFFLFIQLSYQYYEIIGNEACVNCIGRDKKVWRPTQYSNQRFCWHKDEFSLNCGAGTYGLWSDYMSLEGYGSEYLLWENHEQWGMDKYTITDDYTKTISIDNIPKKGVCVIELYNNERNSHKLTFSNQQSWRVLANGFVEEENGEGYITFGTIYNTDYNVESYHSFFLVIIPDQKDQGMYSVRVRAIGDPTRFPLVAILGIVFGSIFCIICVFMTICYWIKRRRAKRTRNAQEQNDVEDNEREDPLVNYNQVPQNLPETTRTINSSLVAEPAEEQVDEGNNVPEGLPIENPKPISTNINDSISSTYMQAPVTKEPLFGPGEAIKIKSSFTSIPSNLEYSINNNENNS